MTDKKSPLIEKKEEKPALTNQEAIKDLLWNSAGPILAAAFWPCEMLVNSAFLGHSESTVLLEGYALGQLTISIVLLSIGTGFASGANMRIATAFGQNNMKQCIIHRNRQIVLGSLLYAVLFIPLCFLNSIYTKMGYESQQITYACQFVYTVAPFIFLYYINRTYTIFSFCVGANMYPFVATVGSGLVHLMSVLLFYVWFDMRFSGICIASALMYTSRFLINYLLIHYDDKFNPEWKVGDKDDTRFFSETTFDTAKLCEHLKDSAFAMIMQVWQLWAQDVFMLMASLLVVTGALGAQQCLRTIGLFLIMIPSGLQIGAMVVIGRAISNKDEQGTWTYYRASMIITGIMAAIQVAILFMFKNAIIGIFTNQDSIINLMDQCFYMLYFYNIAQAFAAVGGSMMISGGQQKFGATVTMVAFWLCGIPIAYFASFHLIETTSLYGIWLGPICANVLLVVLYNLNYMFFITWESVRKDHVKQEGIVAANQSAMIKAIVEDAEKNHDEYVRANPIVFK